jgi:hypothetical protein
MKYSSRKEPKASQPRTGKYQLQGDQAMSVALFRVFSLPAGCPILTGTARVGSFFCGSFLVPPKQLLLAQRFQSKNRLGMLAIRRVNTNGKFGRIDPVGRKFQINTLAII